MHTSQCKTLFTLLQFLQFVRFKYSSDFVQIFLKIRDIEKTGKLGLELKYYVNKYSNENLVMHFWPTPGFIFFVESSKMCTEIFPNLKFVITMFSRKKENKYLQKYSSFSKKCFDLEKTSLKILFRTMTSQIILVVVKHVVLISKIVLTWSIVD